jgi:hypothetical protein
LALFPRCTFEVHLPAVVAGGAPIDGILQLTVPEPIPRAEHLDLFFRSLARAGFGSGRDRRIVERYIFFAKLRVDLPVGEPLPAGEHRYPFRFEVPPYVPPSCAGNDCWIQNVIEARLDVDWARDPHVEVSPTVHTLPSEGVVRPLVMRSPNSFHDSIILELMLESSVVVRGQPIVGRIALRGGHDVRFDAVVVRLVSSWHIPMAHGEYRMSDASPTAQIPRDALVGGQPAPFALTSYPATPHAFRSGFLDHMMFLEVGLDAPWRSRRTFGTDVVVLPFGSVLHPAVSGPALVGTKRLELHSAYLAQATGLRPGRPPTLVEGPVGPTMVRVADSPRTGRLGIDVEIAFPDVELGIGFRPRGMLDALRDSPLLPEPLRAGYVLDFDASVDPAALAAISHAALDGLGGTEEIRLSDHHLGYHVVIADDDSAVLDAIARFACTKAKAIADAIAALPFPEAAAPHRPAWALAARDQGGVLVPTGPSLHGLAVHVRLLGEEERTVGVSIRSSFRARTGGGPVTLVHLDLRQLPVPDAARKELEGGSAPRKELADVRATLPEAHCPSAEHVVLERPGFTADPTSLLVAVDAFVAWLLAARGERRAEAPYR